MLLLKWFKRREFNGDVSKNLTFENANNMISNDWKTVSIYFCKVFLITLRSVHKNGLWSLNNAIELCSKPSPLIRSRCTMAHLGTAALQCRPRRRAQSCWCTASLPGLVPVWLFRTCRRRIRGKGTPIPCRHQDMALGCSPSECKWLSRRARLSYRHRRDLFARPYQEELWRARRWSPWPLR